MKKTELKQVLLDCLQQEIDDGVYAAQQAQEAASHEDNQPENQYDTLSLEAAYLAHGQSERILALQEEKIRISQWPVSDQKTPEEPGSIRLGALLNLQTNQGEESVWLWLTPIGGRQIDVGGKTILVISVDAPLAKRLTGLEEGDQVAFRGQVLWDIDVVI